MLFIIIYQFYIAKRMENTQLCITNPNTVIFYPHSEYEDLRNWQIPNQSTSDRNVSVNSNNEAISTESMNPVHILETSW